jgi:hypothetical protein
VHVDEPVVELQVVAEIGTKRLGVKNPKTQKILKQARNQYRIGKIRSKKKIK